MWETLIWYFREELKQTSGEGSVLEAPRILLHYNPSHQHQLGAHIPGDQGPRARIPAAASWESSGFRKHTLFLTWEVPPALLEILKLPAPPLDKNQTAQRCPQALEDLIPARVSGFSTANPPPCPSAVPRPPSAFEL